jgi:hypothetical protein
VRELVVPLEPCVPFLRRSQPEHRVGRHVGARCRSGARVASSEGCVRAQRSDASRRSNTVVAPQVKSPSGSGESPR